MKKILVILLTAMVLTTMFTGIVRASQGPAPYSGDGIPDGSGWGVDDLPSQGRGPAPNSGDGIPDGPGW
ncbi:hypothetical protein ACFLZP_04505 [Patescibacteria group bacterium]